MAGDRPRVVIAGGSLGGLTAALFLRDAGCNVTVHERSNVALEGRGAGIVLHPASVRYLHSGGRIRVEEVSTRADVLRYLNRDGSVLHEEPCRYRFTSYYTLHRGLLSCLEPESYCAGSQVIRFQQDEEGVDVELGDATLERTDLLVFADGIHSTGRALLLPSVQPSYAGYVGWRGTVSEEGLDSYAFESLHEAITYYVGPKTHILTYPIPDFDGSVEPGKRRINYVWYRNAAEGEEIEDILTDRDGTRRAVSVGPGAVRERHVQALSDAAAEQLPETIAHVVIHSEPFVQAVFDIEVPRMAFGRVCLIGDAAFVIRPHAAAGTAKAAEDAYKLAEALTSFHGDVVQALMSWEPAQLELGRRVFERARDLGDRSQFLGTYRPPDPYLSFGLYRPGDSWMHDSAPTGDAQRRVTSERSNR
jgi:2,6-dihydroxypyridine 3-monooxygenase